MNIKDLFKISSIPVIVASLCCLTPLILVMVGLATVSFAASLADIFYGQYKWSFRLAGVVLLMGALFFYFYRTKKICTVSEVKKRFNEIVNTALVVLIFSILAYIIFLYVIVEIIGILFGLW